MSKASLLAVASKTRRTPAQWQVFHSNQYQWLRETLGLSPERAEKAARVMMPSWQRNYEPLGEWMTSDIGLSSEEASLVIQRNWSLLYNTAENAKAVSDYLRQPYISATGSVMKGGGFGLTNDEIKRALMRSAAILYINPKSVMPTVDWLRGPEYSPTTELAEKLSINLVRNPVLTKASLDGRLRPRHAFATSLFAQQTGVPNGMSSEVSVVEAARQAVPLYTLALHSDQAFLQILPEQPSVMQYRDFEAAGDFKTRRTAAEQERRIQWLQTVVGLPVERAQKNLPRMKSSWEKNYPSWLEFLDGLELSPQESAAMLVKRPGLLDSNTTFGRGIVEYLESDEGLRLSRKELRSVVIRAPALLNLRYKTVVATVEWLRNEFMRDHPRSAARGAVISNPAVLTASLNCRLRPRFSLWRALPNAEPLPLYAFATLSDAKFAEKLGVQGDELSKFIAEVKINREADDTKII